MRKITQEGLDLIKRFEGFSSTVYICPAGHPTIGYGHLVRNHETFETISPEEAEDLLRKDVESAERAVLRLVNVSLTDGQFDALVSFTFNLGAGAFQRSTLRRKVNRQAHDEVPEQLKRWVWAGGRKSKGLITRREVESTIYALAYQSSSRYSAIFTHS
ncbi:lysozyme [Microbulbifer sp. OS29]|uniref:Lysozyme n=1 Tax=Microbulbifer okhotskensis TaxID=2926617 RepID=A0A9X2J526_9GAMM|nr:lysozyme [Microbulbifer okhotskensis]MCO1333150.1 lysozyme [Microbulbifer okhotskensis]